MTEPVHVIEHIMSDAVEKVSAASIEEATAEVHRRTGDHPANVIVANAQMYDPLSRLGPNKLKRTNSTPKETIPDAMCIGVLNHRHYVFVSKHMPPDRILVFNIRQKVYCTVEHGAGGLLF